MKSLLGWRRKGETRRKDKWMSEWWKISMKRPSKRDLISRMRTRRLRIRTGRDMSLGFAYLPLWLKISIWNARWEKDKCKIINNLCNITWTPTVFFDILSRTQHNSLSLPVDIFRSWIDTLPIYYNFIIFIILLAVVLVFIYLFITRTEIYWFVHEM